MPSRKPAQTVLTKQQLAYRYIREAIMSNSLVPGSRLIIDQIATELGISAIPVREALGLLERESLITIRPHAGATVADIPPQAIGEIFGLLESAEACACELVGHHISEEVLGELERLARRMEGAQKASVWTRLNREFHETIPRLMNLPRIEDLLVRTGEEWERLRSLRFAEGKEEDYSVLNAEHREFIDLLGAGERAAQVRWVRRHNRHALKRYVAALGKNASPPEA